MGVKKLIKKDTRKWVIKNSKVVKKDKKKGKKTDSVTKALKKAVKQAAKKTQKSSTKKMVKKLLKGKNKKNKKKAKKETDFCVHAVFHNLNYCCYFGNDQLRATKFANEQPKGTDFLKALI